MLPARNTGITQRQELTAPAPVLTGLLALITCLASWQFTNPLPVFLFTCWCFFRNTPINIAGTSTPCSTATLAGLSLDRDNNFNLLRMLAAWSVLFFHSYVLTGTTPTSWFDTHIGKQMGFYAVNIFFFISGLLVTQSIERSGCSRRYLTARFIRLVPPLCAVMLASILLLGPLMTSLPLQTYFNNQETWLYLIANTSTRELHFTLPGVFANNPYPHIINGSLWTLVYEMRLYLLLFVLYQSGIMRNRNIALCLAGILLVCYLAYAIHLESLGNEASYERAHNILLVHLYFLLGFLAAQLAHRLPVRWRYLAIPVAGVAALRHSPLHDLANGLLVSYLVLLLVYRLHPALHAYNKLGDYSYGTYLYAFPLQQMLVAFFPSLTFGQLVLCATPATLCCAFLSWHLLEKPLMMYVRKNRRDTITGEPDIAPDTSQVNAHET
ncbi:MAG TPA: acyltransferase [Pseudomonadales bacterium]|nr:acyltransferase [Pseudomonadales bacterium]